MTTHDTKDTVRSRRLAQRSETPATQSPPVDATDPVLSGEDGGNPLIPLAIMGGFLLVIIILFALSGN